ncbi:MAG: hypothetical protein RL266_461 [Bacteroidota bacterium]
MARKICFLTPHVYPHYRGGAEVQVSHLCKEMLDRGWEVIHIAESNKPFSESSDPRLKVLFLPKAKRNRKFLQYRRLKTIIETEKPEVIYVRPVLQYLFVAALVAKGTECKVVWACSSDSKLKRSYFLKGLSPLGILNYILFKKALKMVDHLIVQTSYQHDLLLKNYSAESVVIANGHPKPMEKLSDQRSPRIIWIGRSAHVKNPLAFLELAESLSDSKYEFVMIMAKLDAELIGQIIERASRIANLKLLTDISNQEVHSALSDSALLVNTSHSEGFSNTFIEAWMRGVPVLSLNADPEKLLSSQVGGFLCADLSGMKQRIEALLSDQKAWTSSSESCREYALRELSIQNAVNRLEAVIDNQDL